MRSVAAFLGVDSSFDFGPVVAKGKFNSAENRGYEAITPWEQQQQQKTEGSGSGGGGGSGGTSGGGGGVGGGSSLKKAPHGQQPNSREGDHEMSAELRRRLLAFYSPFNERLFDLAGKRCAWPGLGFSSERNL
jgi:hypothetical protein